MTQASTLSPMPERAGRPGPKYRQIAEDLRTAMLNGRYEVGDRLPTKAELQETWGVALNTVDRAYEELRREGLVRTEHGAGTFVAKKPAAPGEPSPEFTKIMQRLDEIEAQIRRQTERIDELERQQRPRGQ
jgi:GntR family transcriptional regulator